MSIQRIQGDRIPSKISKELRAKGVEVYSVCTGFAYPRNGNVFNPTPRLFWIGTLNGRVIARGGTRKAVLETLQIHLEDPR